MIQNEEAMEEEAAMMAGPGQASPVSREGAIAQQSQRAGFTPILKKAKK
jgi:hypothetical protein